MCGCRQHIYAALVEISPLEGGVANPDSLKRELITDSARWCYSVHVQHYPRSSSMHMLLNPESGVLPPFCKSTTSHMFTGLYLQYPIAIANGYRLYFAESLTIIFSCHLIKPTLSTRNMHDILQSFGLLDIVLFHKYCPCWWNIQNVFSRLYSTSSFVSVLLGILRMCQNMKGHQSYCVLRSLFLYCTTIGWVAKLIGACLSTGNLGVIMDDSSDSTV